MKSNLLGKIIVCEKNKYKFMITCKHMGTYLIQWSIVHRGRWMTYKEIMESEDLKVKENK